MLPSVSSDRYDRHGWAAWHGRSHRAGPFGGLRGDAAMMSELVSRVSGPELHAGGVGDRLATPPLHSGLPCRGE